MIGCERSARLDPDTVIVEPIRDDAVRTNTVLDRNQLITMTVQTIDPIVCRRIGDSQFHFRPVCEGNAIQPANVVRHIQESSGRIEYETLRRPHLTWITDGCKFPSGDVVPVDGTRQAIGS